MGFERKWISMAGGSVSLNTCVGNIFRWRMKHCRIVCALSVEGLSGVPRRDSNTDGRDEGEETFSSNHPESISSNPSAARQSSESRTRRTLALTALQKPPLLGHH